MKTKSIWIKAEIRSISFSRGKTPVLLAECFHTPAKSIISAAPCLLEGADKILCFAEGIINSSGNALVLAADGGYVPIGKIRRDFRMEHGVCVFPLQNDLSREEPPDYVKTREDAEKLCLLAQSFPEGWTAAEIATISGIDVSRLDLRETKLLAKFAQAASAAARNSLAIPEISLSAFRISK